MQVSLPNLSSKDWNFSQFPFRALGIARTLRIALLWADERGPENRVLCGAVDFHHDMLLLTPGYS